MKQYHVDAQFGVRQFFKIAIPSYLFPLVFSGLPGYLLNKQELMQASYSTIALPSLLATSLCFLLLAQFQRRQVFLLPRIQIAIVFVLFTICLSCLVIGIFKLHTEYLNIVPSACIGAAVVSMSKPLKKTHEIV